METVNLESEARKEMLGALSVTEFNDQIVLLPIFLCKKCEKFLSCPIMLVPTIGNVCGSCINEEITTSTRNEALEAILEMLLVPCRYHSEGCIERLTYKEMIAHALICRYRNQYCPLKLHAGCMWEGGCNNLIEHCRHYHADSVVTAVRNVVKLELDISRDNENINVINVGSDAFILHAKCDIQRLKQYFAIYDIRVSENPQDYLCSIAQIGCGGLDSIQLSTTGIIRDSEFKGYIDDKAFAIDLSLVKQFCSSSNMCVEIKIVPLNEAEEIQTNILVNFECPVCNNYMRPPIFQCLTGHSLCSQCRSNLTQCPTCRAGFGATRNFTLEAISVNIRFPCIYHDIGCQVVLKRAEVEKHEAKCPLKSHNCPFNDSALCGWRGSLGDIIEHLRTNHNDKLVFTNYEEVNIPFSFDTNYFALYCMVVNRDVFRVCYKRDMSNQNSYWAVQLVGPSDESKKYKTEIGLIDARNEHRRLVRVDLVQGLSSLDNMFTQCIMIPSTTVSWFNWQGKVRYYCKIVKIN